MWHKSLNFVNFIVIGNCERDRERRHRPSIREFTSLKKPKNLFLVSLRCRLRFRFQYHQEKICQVWHYPSLKMVPMAVHIKHLQREKRCGNRRHARENLTFSFQINHHRGFKQAVVPTKTVPSSTQASAPFHCIHSMTTVSCLFSLLNTWTIN